jgi:hypothetical protein
MPQPTGMKKRIALISSAVGGLVVATGTAQGQQWPIGEPSECATARSLYAAGRAREAAEWQRVCLAKRRAPRAAAPPMAPGSPPASRPAEFDPHWMDELPSVADVKAAIKGPDSAARQEAAIGILQDYVEQMTGNDVITLQRMPEPARTRWREYVDEVDRAEYQRTHIRMGNSTPGGPAQAYFVRPGFRTEILSKWMSPNYLAAYRPGMQGVAATDARRADADRAAETRRAEAAAEAQRNSPEAVAAREATESTRKAVARNLEDAKRSHVDLSVFGIRLGEPLDLPFCPDPPSEAGSLGAVAGAGTASTCFIKTALSLDTLIAQVMAASDPVPWAANGVAVKLGHSACPKWVNNGCTILLNVQHDIPLGAFFNTRGIEATKDVEKALKEKYPRASAQRGGRLQCQNDLTGVVAEDTYERHWQLPGLYVSYSPIDSCPNTRIVSTGTIVRTGTVVRGGTAGKVSIELSLSRRQQSDASAQRELAQPKL